MNNESLRERGNSLEEEFFRKQNERLIEQLRQTETREQAREHMTAASGVHDPDIIDQLLDSGMTAATAAALALAPLVAVAWADRRLEDKEKRAVLEEAAAAGVTPASPEYELLSAWLTQQPAPSLMDAWVSYARMVSESLGEEARKEFRDTILERSRAIANAAGGFAGFGKQSEEEQAILTRIEETLQD